MRSTSNSRLRPGSRASTNKDRIKCYNCREYDHFARDCATSREERDMDQLQPMLNLEEEEQTHLLNGTQSNPVESFKLMNGSDGTTASLPLDSKIGGQINCNRPSVGQFLTREQANYVYKKVETGEMISVNTIQHEMEQEEQLSKIDDTSGEINPYRELIVNNAEGIEPLMIQMEQWSILSNVLNYIQHDRHHTMNHTLNIRMISKFKNNSETKEEKEFTELDW